jgi:hypothetical protein
MFHGSLVAIVTPMRDGGDVDFDAWTRLLDFHLENGTDGIVVGGTTGESATLTEAELRELTERACAQVKKRIPIIVGAGTSSTASTLERTRWLSPQSPRRRGCPSFCTTFRAARPATCCRRLSRGSCNFRRSLR